MFQAVIRKRDYIGPKLRRLQAANTDTVYDAGQWFENTWNKA